MKIIAVGWNYLSHNKEMNRTLLPKEPVIFFKPETALLKDGKPFFLPDFSKELNMKPNWYSGFAGWEKYCPTICAPLL